MPKATCDLPVSRPFPVNPPDFEECAEATISALIELLIDAGLVSKEDLTSRAREFVMSTEKRTAASIPKLVGDFLFNEAIDEYNRRKEEELKQRAKDSEFRSLIRRATNLG